MADNCWHCILPTPTVEIAAEAACTPLLPAAHTMDGWRFRIAATDFAIELDPDPCKVYGEKLTYLFYGRPAYRGHNNNKSTSLNSLYLVSFILDLSTMPPLKRIMPFDTGAFHNDLFAPSMHPKMGLSDFEVSPVADSAGKIVARFFGANAAYWRGKPRSDLNGFGFNFEAESYAGLIAGNAKSDYDDRRSAIEMQVDQRIDFGTTSVLAVVMPECLADEPEVKTFLTRSGADGITYECYHARQAEDTRAIVAKTYDYLHGKGLV